MTVKCGFARRDFFAMKYASRPTVTHVAAANYKKGRAAGVASAKQRGATIINHGAGTMPVDACTLRGQGRKRTSQTCALVAAQPALGGHAFASFLVIDPRRILDVGVSI